MDSIAFPHVQAAGFRVFVPLIAEQGDTSGPTRVHIQARTLAGLLAPDHVGPLRVRICNNGAFANATNATIAVAAGSALLETLTANKDLLISEIRGAKAGGTLTISGAVAPGETVTIGSRVYEFVAGNSPGAGRVPVDILAATTRAQGTLTMDTQPTVGDSVTVGTRTYVWVPSGEAEHPGEISIGGDLEDAQANFVAAINGTDDVNPPNDYVTAGAFSDDDCVLTAIVGGTGGNAIATTETFTAGTNVFDAATLGTTTAGADAAAAASVTALVSEISGDALAVVTAEDGVGDTVVVAAKEYGTYANDFASTETMGNGAWGGVKLSGGIDPVPGTYAVDVTDAQVETVTLRIGAAPQGAGFGDFSATLQISHAAPA